MEISYIPVIITIVIGLMAFGFRELYNSYSNRVAVLEKSVTLLNEKQAVDNDRWQRQEKTNTSIVETKQAHAVLESEVKNHNERVDKIEEKMERIESKIDKIIERLSKS